MLSMVILYTVDYTVINCLSGADGARSIVAIDSCVSNTVCTAFQIFNIVDGDVVSRFCQVAWLGHVGCLSHVTLSIMNDNDCICI